jgi:peptidoglycan-associated lipoprotein
MKNIAVSLVVLLLAACASTPNKQPVPVVESSKPISASPQSTSTSSTANAADIESRRLAAKRLAAEIQNLQKQSVYFDFDKSELKPEYRNVIQQQANFLNAHRNDLVTVEGNCDERGSDEYNLALGDKRANTALKSLELLGVLPTQIKTVSFGNAKPRMTCHEEKCWKENRRDDFNHKLN